MADETGMMEKRRKKALDQKPKNREDGIRIVPGGVKSENEHKLEKNAEDNKRNC